MTYSVALVQTVEGYSVSCPGLPGCWSQGQTEEEALENIRDAIQQYLAVARQLAGERELREVEIPALVVGKIAGISHLRAVKALERAGFSTVRQSKHIVMTNGVRIVTIPRHDPVDAYTMAGIVRDDPLKSPRLAIPAIQRGLGAVRGVQVAYATAHALMRGIVQQIPVQRAGELPFRALGELLTHEQQFLARMPPHEPVISPQRGQLPPGIARYPAKDGTFAVHDLVM